MNSINLVGIRAVADAIAKAAMLQRNARVRAAEQIRSGLVALGCYIGVAHPLLTWVLS